MKHNVTIKAGIGTSNFVSREGHSLRPIRIDDDGEARFVQNDVVVLLMNDGKYDMNRLSMLHFTDTNRSQLAQMLGYSVRGFGELPYVTGEERDAADEVVQALAERHKS